MAKKLLQTRAAGWLLPPIVGALAMVIWGMAFWGVLYEPLGVFHDTSPGIEQAAKAMEEAGVETGTYFYPWPRNTPEAAATWLEKHRAGPFFKLSYVRDGVDPQAPAKMLGGLAQNILVALLGLLLLRVSGAAERGFRTAVLTVLLAGSIGTLFIQIGDPIWFHLPWDYVLGSLIYEGGSWLALGLALAWALSLTSNQA